MSEQTASLCTTDACESLRAQLPSQGGEAVEVVAWQDAENPLHTTASRRVMHEWSDNGYPIAELMTVSQHQRILAASVADPSAVAVPNETALRRAARFLDKLDSGCNEVKTLRALLAKPCQHTPLTSQYGTWCELCEKKLD